MRRFLIFACVLALAVACQSGCGKGDLPGNGTEGNGSSSDDAPLLGPVSEVVGLASLLRTGTSPANQASRAYQLDMNQAAGIKYLRNEFMWNSIESSSGVFDYSGYDTIVAEAEAHGIEFIGLLCYGNPWASSWTDTEKMYPPDDPEDFALFAAETVTRYKDKIHYWEIWNEQNTQRFWKPETDAEAYGNLLKSAAIAIRSADPEAKVVFGGLAPFYSSAWENMWGFLEEVYVFHPDIGEYFDILAIHTYTWVQIAEPETDDPINPLKQSVPRMITDARDVLLRWESRTKPIWITEMGWYTAINDPLGHVTEEDQARFLVRSFILSVANGVEKYCWFTFRDSWDYLNDSEDAFGLVGYDPDPTDANPPVEKQSYHAYSTLSSVLGDTYYYQDIGPLLGLTDTQYAYQFVTLDGEKSVIALWTTDDTPSSIQVPPAADMKTFTQLDMLGNFSILTPSNGLLNCLISQSPIYVVEEKYERVTEIKFVGDASHIDGDRPPSTSNGNEPAITSVNYTKVVRQIGDFTGTVRFTDPDDYTGVTTLLIQIDQDEGYWEFPVTPFYEPLSETTNVPFSIRLAHNFTPGIFTFYIGLRDTDGNVSNYQHKVLIVKSLEDLSITSLTPLDGTTGAPLNVSLRTTFSQQVFSHESIITLLEGANPVAGTTYMSGTGRAMTFIPDSFLLPDTLYNATVILTVNQKYISHSFTTAVPLPLGTPSDLVGKTFSVAMTPDNLIEPEEGKSIFETIPVLPTILMKTLEFNVDTFQTLSAAGTDDGAGGNKQNPMVPTFGPNPSEFVNPYFISGPTSIIIDLGAMGLPGIIGVHGVYVSGNFVESGGVIVGFENGSFSAYLDSAEVNPIISVIAMGEVDVCEILPLCDKDGLIRIRAENVDGLWETGIDKLYDMECTADRDSITASTGGNIIVTCTILEDAVGYLGNDIKFMAQTGVAPGVGIWDTTGYTCTGTPPSCQVPDSSGQISLTLTIAPGELTPGGTSFRVGGSNNTPVPIGVMKRAKSVTVE